MFHTQTAMATTQLSKLFSVVCTESKGLKSDFSLKRNNVRKAVNDYRNLCTIYQELHIILKCTIAMFGFKH